MSNTGFNQVFGSYGTTGFGNGYSYSKKTYQLIQDGLVLNYDIGNPSSYSGGMTVYDLMKNSNATLYNSPTYSNNYITFNGSNQYLLTELNLGSDVPTDVTTISLWAYPMDNGVLLTEQGNLPINSGWHDSQIEMVGGVTKFRMWNGGVITSSVSTPLNNWYNYIVTYDGTTLRAYVNGTSAGSLSFARENPIENGAGLFYAIAAADSTNLGDGSYANMRLGEFQVYNRALSNAEVLNNFTASRDKYGV